MFHWILVIVQDLGTERIVFGGDWPVAVQATDYPRWVATLDWALSGHSEEELRKCIGTTQYRFMDYKRLSPRDMVFGDGFQSLRHKNGILRG